MDSERFVGHKRNREEICSTSGSLCYGEPPVFTDGRANFNSKPVRLDFPLFEILEVPEDVRQSLEKIGTAAVECRKMMPPSGFGKLLESLENMITTAIAECKECPSFISKPISLDFPCFENLEVSEDLRQSLEKISTAAAECRSLWNQKSTTYEEMVPLSEFQKLLESHGLLWHKCIVFENGGKINADQLISRINKRPYDIPHLLLTSGSLLDKATDDFIRVCRICGELDRNFNGEQVGQLASFLEYLIMVLEEQRYVPYSFVDHLLQLKKSIVRLNDLCTNKSNVACDGVEDGYPCGKSKNPTVRCLWKQKHIFDGLYIMSWDSSSLLKEAEDKSDSCSTVNGELLKILGIINGKEFMAARKLLGRMCFPNSVWGEFPVAEHDGVFVTPKPMQQFLRSNFETLDHLQCVLQGQIAGKSSVTEKLIGCFQDVLSKGKLIEKEYLDGVEHRKQLLQKTGSFVDIEAISEIEFAKSVEKTKKQIDESVQKLVLLRSSILSEDSPHGNITLWRVLYESSLVSLQLDLICENLNRIIELGVKLLDSGRLKDSIDLNQLHASIVELIGSCNGVLLDFLAMHKTVAEVACMVAEAFVPRCKFGFKTFDKEDFDIYNDVSNGEDADDDFDTEDPVPSREEDMYDMEDPEVMYFMSGRRYVENFDDEP